jgi:hypothetical protein
VEDQQSWDIVENDVSMCFQCHFFNKQNWTACVVDVNDLL